MDIMRTMLQQMNHVVYTFLSLSGCIWIYKFFKKQDYPPGPLSFPIIGNASFVGNTDVHLQLFQLGNKYGPIFSIRLGSKRCVILNSAQVIREAFSKAELNERFLLPSYESLNISNPLFENGTLWHQHRSMLMQVFKEYGIGKSSLNDLIGDEVKCFLEVIASSKEAPQYIREPLTISLSNISSHLIFGNKLDKVDQVYLNMKLEKAFNVFQSIARFSIFPWILYLPFFRKLNNRLIKDLREIRKFIRSNLEKEIEKQKSSVENSDRTSYTSMYLTQMRTRSDNSKTTFDNAALYGSVVNFYEAATSNTLATLEWCFYVVAAMPQIQRKIHEEIDNAIGRERLPTFLDQKSLPFTHSFILETQRHYTVVPLNSPRVASEDIKIMGYTIPKGTWVIANLYAVHHDPNIWNKPNDFIPDRFLDSETKTIKKHENYLPFSFGKRNCPGKNLANTKIFYYFTNILQWFEIQVPEGKTMNLKGIMNASFGPEFQKLCFIRRV